MNQYLVAIHYIQLLQAELDILNHDARLLFDLKIEPNLAKRELADLKVSLSKLSDKNLYIEVQSGINQVCLQSLIKFRGY